MINHVFVYGTLKEGRPLDRSIFAEARKSVIEATINGKIYHVNFYPGVKLGGKDVVHGEIHEFDSVDMKAIVPLMDAIEGFKEGRERNLFNRKVVKATAENGEELDAYVYEYAGEVDEARRVKEGLWEPE